LTAANYSGRDRATAYGVLGGVTAAGAAAGPLIGGWVTEALTWRVVFASETLVCIGIMLTLRLIADSPRQEGSRKIDWVGTALSALGLGLIVLAILKASEWGFLQPRGALEIGGHEITPFGFSVVPFMVGAGFLVLSGFFSWERRVVARGGSPLMHPDILLVRQLRSGLSMLAAQQTVIAGTFFVLPIYLQFVLLKSAFETGLVIMPMSIAMLIGAFSGPRLAVKRSPRDIVRLGLWLVVVGCVVLMASISPKLNSPVFALGLALFGAGAGLIASQLGNVIMSSVGDRERGEAGGLQGTAQNVGSSLGVALIGAVLLASLGSGLNDRVATDPNISAESKAAVQTGTNDGVEILTRDQVTQIADESGLPKDDADAIVAHYYDAQIFALKLSLLFAGFLAALGLLVARGLPTMPGVELGAGVEEPAPA
jgi:MFS family permease